MDPFERSRPTNAADRRVAIFCCGVQKGGTTSLFLYLKEHPSLSAPQVKELHFFDDETQDWSAPDYTKLEAGFCEDDGLQLRFEATPIYVFWPSSIERIHTYNPQAKLIFLFRDPFERAWSHWQMEYRRGSETLPFAEAIREGRQRMAGLAPNSDMRRVYTYIERGLYSAQVRRALANFPREQLLFIRSQDLFNDYAATLAMIANFLEVDAFSGVAPKHAFGQVGAGLPALSTDNDRRYVADLVRADLLEFAVLTGLDVSDWPTMTMGT